MSVTLVWTVSRPVRSPLLHSSSSSSSGSGQNGRSSRRRNPRDQSEAAEGSSRGSDFVLHAGEADAGDETGGEDNLDVPTISEILERGVSVTVNGEWH